MQLYAFVSEIVLIGVLIKIITLIKKKSRLAHGQLTQNLIISSLTFIIITAIAGALVYLGRPSIHSINLIYIHTLFSLLAKQLAMPIVVICLIKNIIEPSSNQLIRTQILRGLLILCLIGFSLVALFSFSEFLYKIADISLVVSGLFFISHAIKTSQNVLHAVGSFICLIAMAVLPIFFTIDSQPYVVSLHLFLVSYLYFLSTAHDKIAKVAEKNYLNHPKRSATHLEY